jgi:hypothetical protein
MHKFKAEIIDWLNGGKYEHLFNGVWLPVKDLIDFHFARQVIKIEKPKTKKMVQWLFKEKDGAVFVGPYYYYIGIKPSFFNYTPIKPLPNTEIEVEE